MDNTTANLVDFALSVDFAKLDRKIVHECKRRLVDTFACALGARREPLCIEVLKLASRYSGDDTATIWGSAQRSNVEMAAFANGVLLRALDLSDTYLARGGAHPSDLVAGVVAVGESMGASGPALIEATVVGYEIYCQFMEAIDLRKLGWDQAVIAVLATVIAAGKIAGLSRAQMGHAISLGLTPNMALRQTRHGELSHWKGCAGGNAARNAAFAVMLAKAGIEGPADIFEGKQGIWAVLGKFEWPSRDVMLTTQMITRTHFKSIPVCYHGQAAALAGFELYGQQQPDDIADILVETYREAVELIGTDPLRWQPRTRESADHSFPYIVACALADGGITEKSFAPERLVDPGLAELMKRVRVQEDPILSAMYPGTGPARVTVTTKSGRVTASEVRYPKGHIMNTFSDEDLSTKFRCMWPSTEHSMDSARCDGALSALWNVETARDIGRDLLPAIRSQTEPN
jgi:2-methylcitrate dehydratase